VVGIATIIVGRGTGIGFAVPANMARRIGEQLLAKGKVDRAWIGVTVQDVTPDLARELNVPAGAGALINSVAPDSPGSRGNLKSGDVVITVNGKQLQQAHDLLREVLLYEPGRTVAMEVLRSGKRYATHATLASRNEPVPSLIPAQIETSSGKNFGLTIRDGPGGFSPSSRSSGSSCQVTAVIIGSPADRAGILAGDVVVEADGKVDPDTNSVQQATADGHAVLRMRRKEAFFYVALRK